MSKQAIQFLLTVGLLILGTSGLLFAQAGSDLSKGQLTVDVQDTTGAVIQGADVTLTGAAGTRRLKTDLRGTAAFYSLAPGTYSIKIENAGFRAFDVQNIVVNAARISGVIAKMEPGAVTETVQVTGEAVAIDTSSTTTGTVIAGSNIMNLPVARSVSGLFGLAAGAAPGGGADNNATPNQSFNPSISGSSGLENQYIIDGVNATDQGYGAFGVWSNVYGSMGSGVNFDFIKEVQVKTGGFEAQYGQALGGILNIVTESGTNHMRTSVYAYGSPAFMEATYKQPNDFPRASRPVTEMLGRHSFDFGVNAGGPIKKDKAFWYGGFNPRYTTLARTAPQGFAVRNLGPQNWDSHNYNWVGKLNYNLGENHRLEGTAFGDPSRDTTGVHRNLLRDDLDATSKASYGTQNWAVKYNGVFTPTTLFNASFGQNRSFFDETPANNTYSVRDYGKPKPGSAYTNIGGVGFLENNDSRNNQYGAMLTKTMNLLGGHTFDLGYGYNDVSYTATRLYSGPDYGVVAGRGVAAGDVGKQVNGGFFYFYPTRSVGGVTYQNVYRAVRGNFTEPQVGTATSYHNAFLQDAWQLNKFVTVKAGLRWEQQGINGNTTSYKFATNWAPRIGFIIDPTGTRKTKLFANWGRFFEKIPQDPAVRSMSSESGYNNQNFFSLPPTTGNLVPGSVASPTGVDPTVIFGGTKAQYQEEIVAGVEREIGKGLVLSVRFIHRDLKRIIEDISGITAEQAVAGVSQQYIVSNPSASLDVTHNPVACTSGSNCDTDIGYTVGSGALGPDGKPDGFPDPRRMYKALEVTADKRFGQNWSLMANYRLSKLFGNIEGLYRNDNDQSDPNVSSLFDFAYSPVVADQFKIGLLPNDRTHVMNLFGNYMWKGLNLGLGYQMLTGIPISKLLAHPAYANAGELPLGGRGTYGRTPAQNYFNSRVDYAIKLKSDQRRLRVGIDMFNIFNRKTTTKVDEWAELDGAVPSQDFGKPYSISRPFYARFSIRLDF